jgi:mRNA-degrading endonuclease RelE of RelBE toxin-antitoxin system
MSGHNFTLIFHPLAEADYADAYYWYELKEPGLGERFMSEFRQKLEKVLVSPENYGPKTKKGYRESRLKSFPYSIVYRVDIKKQVIYISSIHHESKHPNNKFRK